MLVHPVDAKQSLHHVSVGDVPAPTVWVVAVLRRPAAACPVDGCSLDISVRVELIRGGEVDVRLEQPVANQLQRDAVHVLGGHVEVLPGKFDRVEQRGAHNVLDHVRSTTSL